MFYRTSVIIVNWNNHEDTIKCINYLKRSRTLCKIIVVDNASDNTDVERLNKVKGITLIKNAENLGFGRGNNIGIRWALSNTNCDFIFLLNNDATIKDDTISKLEYAMEVYPEAGIVTPRIVLAEDPRVLWYGGGEVIWSRGAVWSPGIEGPSDAEIAMKERNVTFASGCAILVRRAVFENVGGFDPRFFMYEEDLEFCLRVTKAGWQIRYIPTALVLHKVYGSQRKDGHPLFHMQHPQNPRLPFFVYHMIRNKLLTMKKHAKGKNAFKFYFFSPVYWTAKCMQFVLYGRWDAVWALLRGVKDFIQASRKPFVNELCNSSNVRKFE